MSVTLLPSCASMYSYVTIYCYVTCMLPFVSLCIRRLLVFTRRMLLLCTRVCRYDIVCVRKGEILITKRLK